MQKAVDLRAYRKILVPFDGSPGSEKALRRALLMAREQGAEVTTYSVDEHVPRYAPGVGEMEEQKELQQAHLSQLQAKARDVASRQGGKVKTAAEVGHAAQCIISFAEQGAFDVIVIGHSGHSGLWGTLLGSTTQRVVAHAGCDVLVVR